METEKQKGEKARRMKREGRKEKREEQIEYRVWRSGGANAINYVARAVAVV